MLTETWRALVRRYVVYDIPDEMTACFDCNAAICPDEKYRTCPRRLACCAPVHELGTTPPNAVYPAVTGR